MNPKPGFWWKKDDICDVSWPQFNQSRGILPDPKWLHQKILTYTEVTDVIESDTFGYSLSMFFWINQWFNVVVWYLRLVVDGGWPYSTPLGPRHIPCRSPPFRICWTKVIHATEALVCLNQWIMYHILGKNDDNDIYNNPPIIYQTFWNGTVFTQFSYLFLWSCLQCWLPLSAVSS